MAWWESADVIQMDVRVDLWIMSRCIYMLFYLAMLQVQLCFRSSYIFIYLYFAIHMEVRVHFWITSCYF